MTTAQSLAPPPKVLCGLGAFAKVRYVLRGSIGTWCLVMEYKGELCNVYLGLGVFFFGGVIVSGRAFVLCH